MNVCHYLYINPTFFLFPLMLSSNLFFPLSFTTLIIKGKIYSIIILIRFENSVKFSVFSQLIFLFYNIHSPLTQQSILKFPYDLDSFLFVIFVPFKIFSCNCRCNRLKVTEDKSFINFSLFFYSNHVDILLPDAIHLVTKKGTASFQMRRTCLYKITPRGIDLKEHVKKKKKVFE